MDIGSNTGFYGLLALAKGCAVVFVEPQPECNVLISWSIRESGLDERKVRRVQQPVGGEEELGKSLTVRSDNHCSGRFPIENAERGHKNAYGSSAASADSKASMQIPFLPVSNMLELVGLNASSKIQLIKIDTEGNELQILEAMLPLLHSWQVSNMVVEVTPMWWRHTGYSKNTGAEIFEQIADLGFHGSTIRGHKIRDAAAMHDYIILGHIYQDDLWLRRNATASGETRDGQPLDSFEPNLYAASTSNASASGAREATFFGTSTEEPLTMSLYVPAQTALPANAKRHDVSEVIKFHGQSVASATSNFVMFDVDSAMFSWLKTKGEQFVQEIGSLTIEAGIIALKRTRRRSQASKPRPQGHLRFKATQFKVNCRARLHYCTTTCTRTASGHLPPDAGYNLPGGHVAKRGLGEGRSSGHWLEHWVLRLACSGEGLCSRFRRAATRV